MCTFFNLVIQNSSYFGKNIILISHNFKIKSFRKRNNFLRNRLIVKMFIFSCNYMIYYNTHIIYGKAYWLYGSKILTYSCIKTDSTISMPIQPVVWLNSLHFSVHYLFHNFLRSHLPSLYYKVPIQKNLHVKLSRYFVKLQRCVWSNCAPWTEM